MWNYYIKLTLIPKEEKKKVMPRKKKSEYNLYMKSYMRNYRRLERDLLRKAKAEFGWKPPRKRKRRKKR